MYWNGNGIGYNIGYISQLFRIQQQTESLEVVAHGTYDLCT